MDDTKHIDDRKYLINKEKDLKEKLLQAKTEQERDYILDKLDDIDISISYIDSV